MSWSEFWGVVNQIGYVLAILFFFSAILRTIRYVAWLKALSLCVDDNAFNILIAERNHGLTSWSKGDYATKPIEEQTG